MIVFPNCKINLGLNIVNKRSDGYHDIETVFYPLGLRDALEIIEQTVEIKTTGPEFNISGNDAETLQESNICIAAYNLLKKDFPSLPSVKMHLHKTIPTGAGLGGGSADGAFTLQLLNKKFNLGIPEHQLLKYALLLGSDCPFFIVNKPCHASGRGEYLSPINIDLLGYKFLIVFPDIHISTAKAFSGINPSVPAKRINEIILQPPDTWKEELKNDFEESVFNTYPELEKIKTSLYGAGAIYSSLSGSGSAMYGIFEKNITPVFDFPENYFVEELICEI